MGCGTDFVQIYGMEVMHEKRPNRPVPAVAGRVSGLNQTTFGVSGIVLANQCMMWGDNGSTGLN
jgi:hypothetical protein